MMPSFEFDVKTKILFGTGALSKLSEEIKKLHIEKPLIITDRGIEETGLLNQVKETLRLADLQLNVFNEVESNPSSENVESGLRFFRARNCDSVIAVGGGSSMDVAKAVAVLSTNEGSILDYIYWKRTIEKPIPPVITIPTTAGTGSEVNWGIVIKDSATKKKLFFAHESMRPKLAIVDPIMTLNLPSKLTAGTGADALAHAVESYVGVGSNPVSEAFSLLAISLISDNLREAVSNGKNIDARSNMALAATIAGITLTWGTTFNHEITSVIGGETNVHHGVLCAILLPPVLEYCLNANVKKLANIARAMRCDIDNLPEIEVARTAIKAIQKLFLDVGLPKTLNQVGVEEKFFAQWADMVMGNEYVISNTLPRASKKDIIQILKNANTLR